MSCFSIVLIFLTVLTAVPMSQQVEEKERTAFTRASRCLVQAYTGLCDTLYPKTVWYGGAL